MSAAEFFPASPRNASPARTLRDLTVYPAQAHFTVF